MEKIGSYETLFVVNAQLTEEDTKAMVEKFTALISANGTIDTVNEWGKRRLAYPINDMPEGYYVVVTFKAPAEFPAELERLFNIDERILRSVLVRLEHEPAPKAPVEEAPVVEEVVAPAEVEAVEAPADAE